MQYNGVEHWNRGGGTGYSGWFDAFGTHFVEDCLMDHVQTQDMRHSPVFQGNASGNVIRNGLELYASKQDYHSGPAMYNLLETTRLDQRGKAMGSFRSPQLTATIHSPAGPGNVTFNNDYICERKGLYIGGLNEDWIYNYNRLYVELGKPTPQTFWPMILFYDNIDGFLFKGNIFISPHHSGDGPIHYLPRFPRTLSQESLTQRYGKSFYKEDGRVDNMYRSESEMPADESPLNASRNIRFENNAFYGFGKDQFFTDPHPEDDRRPNGDRYNRLDVGSPPHNRDFFDVNVFHEKLPHESIADLRKWPDVPGWPATEPFAPSLYVWQYQKKYGVKPWSPEPQRGPWNLPNHTIERIVLNKENLAIDYISAHVAIDGKVDALWADVEPKAVDQNTPQGCAFTKVGPNDRVPDAQDLSGDFKACWNQHALYLLVSVRDDHLRDNQLEQWWTCDGVEIYIDADNSKGRFYDGFNDSQIGFLPLRRGIFHYKGPYSAGQIKADFVLRDDGYAIEMMLPWSALGFEPRSDLRATPGHEIGFNAVLVDNDRGNASRQRRLSWVHDYDERGRDKSAGAACYFGTITLRGEIDPGLAVPDVQDAAP